MTTSEPRMNQQVRDEMTQLQSDLEQALEETLREVGNKLKPQEKGKDSGRGVDKLSGISSVSV